MRLALPISMLALWLPGSLHAQTDVKPIAVVALKRSIPVDYANEIKPILAKKCLVCHSGKVIKGGLDFSSHASMIKGGKRGRAVVPGKSGESLLVMSAGRTERPIMPPIKEKSQKPLTPQELALLKLWIDQGAKPGKSEATKIALRPLSPAVHVVRAVAIAPNKRQVTAGRANQIHVYDARDGKHLRTLLDPQLAAPAAHRSIIEELAYSPDGAVLASGSLQEISLWDAETGNLRARLTGLADRVVTLDFSPDGRFLAAGGGAPTIDGEIKIFEVQTGKLLLNIEQAHSDTVFGVSFGPTGRRLATCSADQSIKIFEFPSGKLIKKLEGHTHHVLAVSWQADGKLLASAGADRKVRLWDYETGEQHTRINRGGGAISTVFLDHKKQVNRLAFVGDTTQLITCSGNQPVKLWRLNKEMRPGNYAKPYMRGGVAREFGDGSEYLYAVGISPDGSLVAAGGQAGVVRVYNGTDGKLLFSLAPPGVEVTEAKPPVAPK